MKIRHQIQHLGTTKGESYERVNMAWLKRTVDQSRVELTEALAREELSPCRPVRITVQVITEVDALPAELGYIQIESGVTAVDVVHFSDSISRYPAGEYQP